MQMLKVAVTVEQIKYLREYVELNGPDHDEECPGDDTCECLFKSRNDAINELCKIDFKAA
jgi:hypothetical protein